MTGDTQKRNSVPTFADVIRTTAQKTLRISASSVAAGAAIANAGMANTGVVSQNTLPTNVLPGIRSYSDNSARRMASGVRYGQNLENSITTASGFYSPFLTVQAQQTPNSRQMEYTYAQWWYTNEPRVAAAIDFYSTFPLSGFTLECSNPVIKEYFEDLVKKLNVQKWLTLLAHEYYLRGDVFLLASLDCKHCKGLSYDNTGEPCKHDGATWGSLCILNPDRMEATPSLLGSEPQYYYMPNEDMKRVVSTGQPKHLYDMIPEELRKTIASDQPIFFNEISLWHLKHGAAPFQNFGQSLIRRCFMTLAYKDKLRQAQWIIAERHILPIKVVKIGDKDRPANDEDLDAATEQLAGISNSPLATIVTHDAWDMEYIGATGKFATVTEEFNNIQEELLDGFMLNKGMLNGEGPAVNAATIGLLICDRRFEQFRREVSYWIEERLFKPISDFNGFIEQGERGQEKPIYPTIKWDDLKLRDESAKLQIMAQLQQSGVIDTQTLLEQLDLPYDQIVERLRLEQTANSANSPDIVGGGYGGSLGNQGGMGSGFGGMGGGMGMQQPNPGGFGGMGMGGGAGMGLMASVADSEASYRTASAIIREISDNQKNNYENRMNIRTAGITVKSDAHERFLRSISPVTGRGFIGILPEEMDEIFPMSEVGPPLGGYDAMPMNRDAHVQWSSCWSEERSKREVLAQSKNKNKQMPPRILFTKLEQQLYKTLVNANIPYALFAQYKAGPGMQYQLDAAIPAIKLGIEADSEIYHNNANKISEDRRRDMELASQGWTILRFTEDEIERQAHEIMGVVIQTIKKITSRNNQTGNSL